MAVDEDSATRLRRPSRIHSRQLKDRLFELTLLGSTWVGILSLGVLFGYIAFDAFRPLTASARWYLLGFGTVVTPTAAFTIYARRRPGIRATNTKSFAVVLGGLAVSLLAYVVADALNPYDVLVYVLFGTIPPLATCVYGRTTDNRTVAGPAIPVAIIVGLGVAAGLFEFVRPIVAMAPEWVTYFVIVTFPVSGILGSLEGRRHSRRRGVLTALSVISATVLVTGGSLAIGIAPSFWVVIFSTFVIPVGYFVGRTVNARQTGWIGIFGPFLVFGGIILGLLFEKQFGIRGIDGYLTPTLLLHSWDGLTASNAGVYPQIVGSIIIVGFMAIRTFPIGIGAAVFLEEYAPTTGWGGRLTTLLEVNISNLAGVPSVVYGLLGLALFRNTLGFGTGIVAAASGTLGLLILPIVVVSAQEAIRAVPASMRQASYGMGASRWQTLRNVVIPQAVPGVLTGTIVALARAIGETAPLVIIAVATTAYTPPEGLFSSATALPLQIFAARSNVSPEFRHGVVPAAAVVLLVLMVVMNATAILVRNRFERGN